MKKKCPGCAKQRELVHNSSIFGSNHLLCKICGSHEEQMIYDYNTNDLPDLLAIYQGNSNPVMVQKEISRVNLSPAEICFKIKDKRTKLKIQIDSFRILMFGDAERLAQMLGEYNGLTYASCVLMENGYGAGSIDD